MPKLVINANFCKACGYCVMFCPKKILKPGEEINAAGYPFVVQTDPESCIGCAICCTMCPEGAIELYQ